MRRLLFILIACLLICFVGCTKKYHLKRDNLNIKSPWPFHHGQANSQGVDAFVDFKGDFDRLWTQKISGKLVGPLTIHNNALMFPSARKKIRAYALINGDYLGKIKTRGPIQSGVSIADSIAFFAVAPKKSRLKAVNLLNGKTLWKRTVKDVCQGSIIVNNVLIVSSTNGEVIGLDYNTGDLIWTYLADQRLIAPPVLSGDTVFQIGDQGRLYLLSANDGTELSSYDFKREVVAPVIVGKTVYVNDLTGSVYALDLMKNRPSWQTDLEGPLWTSGALGTKELIVANSRGKLFSLDLKDGSLRWQVDLGLIIKASPIIVGEYVIVGTAAGRVYCLELESGQELASIELVGSIDFSPVTDGSRIYVATDEGRIVCLGKQDENAKAEH